MSPVHKHNTLTRPGLAPGPLEPESVHWLLGHYVSHISVVNKPVDPLAPMSDQDRIVRYGINTMSSRQVITIKKNTYEGMISWSTTKFSKQT